MLTIAPATAEDVPALQNLYRHLIAEEASAPLEVAVEKPAQLALYDGSCVLIARDRDTPVATLTLIIVPNMTR